MTPKQISLTMHLIREGVSVNDCIGDADGLVGHDIAKLDMVGKVFIKSRPARPPWWVDFIDPLVSDDLVAVNSASMSGVVVLEVDRRVVAFSFGRGRHLLKREAIELDFGLRTALNALDPEKLRSLDLRTYEEVAVMSRKQVSRSTNQSPFAIDTFRDVLTAVVGAPVDDGLGKRIIGRDSIVLTQAVEVSELASVATRLLDLYERDTYKTHFEWIDRVKRVRDRAVVAALDKLLESALGDPNPPPLLYLAPPEILYWDNVEHFRYESQYKSDKRTFEDLDLADWIDLPSRSKSSLLDRSKQDHALVVRQGAADALPVGRVYDCIVFEAEHLGARYALLAGEWFALDSNFVDEINKQIASVDVWKEKFPPVADGEREDAYVERVSEELDGYCVLDKKTVMIGGGQNKIEVCDLLRKDGVFVHAKKRSASSTLSHLWAQGSVSARTLKASGEFRSRVVAKVPADFEELFGSAPETDRFKLVYLIMGADSDNPAAQLPFFSKVALSQVLQDIALSGFRLSLAGAPAA